MPPATANGAPQRPIPAQTPQQLVLEISCLHVLSFRPENQRAQTEGQLLERALARYGTHLALAASQTP
jgi:hypothetical protein